MNRPPRPIPRAAKPPRNPEPSRYKIGDVELTVPYECVGDPATLRLAADALLSQPLKGLPQEAAERLRQLGSLLEHRAPDVAARLAIEAQRLHPTTSGARLARRVTLLAKAWSRLQAEERPATRE